MQKQATFFLLDKHSSNKSPTDLLLFCVCQQAAIAYRQQQKVFIYTQNQTQAHNVDELLWAFDADSFVPHNLIGEGPNYGSPVEISWQAPSNRRSVLINLTDTVPPFAAQFNRVIDFVPIDETLKQQARQRYRAYQQLAFAVKMHPEK
ncbi:MAG: DNA polymerase III subunit chi [Alteromonadaceae bacterium]|nr:DNA polymerase III subunit chi [Alteromonadaceae bacterium]